MTVASRSARRPPFAMGLVSVVPSNVGIHPPQGAPHDSGAVRHASQSMGAESVVALAPYVTIQEWAAPLLQRIRPILIERGMGFEEVVLGVSVRSRRFPADFLR